MSKIASRSLHTAQNSQYKDLQELREALKKILVDAGRRRAIYRLIILVALSLISCFVQQNSTPDRLLKHSYVPLSYELGPPGPAIYNLQYALLAGKSLDMESNSGVGAFSSSNRVFADLVPPALNSGQYMWSNGSTKVFRLDLKSKFAHYDEIGSKSKKVVFDQFRLVSIKPALRPPANKKIVKAFSYEQPLSENIQVLGDIEDGLVLNGGDFIVHSLNLKELPLTIAGSTPTRFFIQGDEACKDPIVSTAYNVKVNYKRRCVPGLPRNFQIWYNGKRNIEITGNTCYSGVIYAPNACVKLDGNVEFVGAIVAKDIICDGNTHVFFDKDLLKIDDWNLPNSQVGESKKSK